MKDIIYLVKLNDDPIYKFAVVFQDDNDVIKFGRKPYSDMIHHKNENRKMNYIKRHIKNEDWTKTGLKTRGYWSRWILWNKPTIEDSIKDLENRFNVNIIYYDNI